MSLGSLTGSTGGTISGSLRVPAGVSPGQHELELTGKDAGGLARTIRAGVTVTAASATPPPTAAAGLPRSGTDVARTCVFGLLMLVFGRIAFIMRDAVPACAAER